MQKSQKKKQGWAELEKTTKHRLNLGKLVEKRLSESLFHSILVGNHLYLLGSDKFKRLLLLYKPH